MELKKRLVTYSEMNEAFRQRKITLAIFYDFSFSLQVKVILIFFFISITRNERNTVGREVIERHDPQSGTIIHNGCRCYQIEDNGTFMSFFFLLPIRKLEKAIKDSSMHHKWD